MAESIFQRVSQIRPHETRPVLWAFAAHFALFAGYNMLRPLREMIGIRGGVDKLSRNFLVTFLAMLVVVPLYSWLVARMPRRRFIPIVYHFFGFNLALFAAGFYLLPPAGVEHIGTVYFVWVSVFNLFAVSVYWSFMADVFTSSESKRIFGFLAAGASLGSLAGSLLMEGLLPYVDAEQLELLLLVPIVFFELTVFAIRKIGNWLDEQRERGDDQDRAANIARADSEVLRKGGIWSGLVQVVRSPYLAGICAYMLCATAIGTQVYFHQAAIVDSAGLDDLQKTQLFNRINLAVNSITLLVQALVIGRLIQRLGVSITLVALPLFYVIGFVFLGAYPVLWTLVAFQVARRAANYGIAKPSKEVLFTVVSRDEKYKSKSFIDTVVYRGGDALGSAAFTAFTRTRTLSTAAWATIPFCVLWALVAWLLGRQQQTLALQQDTSAKPAPTALPEGA